MALCTVSGNLKTILGANSGPGTVRFTLTNLGTGNTPIVSGTGALVPLTTDVTVDATGAFSVALQGNDTITPSNTLYAVTFYAPNGAIGPNLYSITGSTFNLNTALATSSAPPVVYNNLDANLAFTGNNTFAGTTALNGGGSFAGTFTGNPTLSGNITFSGSNTHSGTETFANLNSIIFVDGTTHTTLASALAACPTTGCWVIDTTPETFTSNPFAGFTGNALIDFGAGTWTTNVQIVVPTKTVLHGIGRGDAGTANTTIKASATFPASTALVRLSNGGTSNPGSRVESMTLDCNSIAGCIGLYSTDANERSGAIDITVANFPASGIKIDASANVGSGPAQHYILRDIELYPQSAGAAGTVGLIINANGGEGPDEVSNVTYVGNSGAVSTNCFTVDNMTAGRFNYLHGEQCANVLNIGGTTGISGGNFGPVTGGPGTTTVVRVAGTSTSFNLFNINTDGVATNAIVDSDRGRTITSTSVGMYVIGSGGTQPIITSDASQTMLLPSTAFLGSLNINGQFLSDGTVTSATAGLLRLGTSQSVQWRNNANSANVSLAKDTSDRLTFNGNVVRTPVYNAAGTLQDAAHSVADTATLSGGTVTVTLSGSAVFTSATTFSCVANDDTGLNPVKVVNNSGSSITFSGTTTDVVRYICVGN